jgi:polysaccharide deacetylase 2 family uncharacterized protein YibQ
MGAASSPEREAKNYNFTLYHIPEDCNDHQQINNYKLHMVYTSHMLQLSITACMSYCSGPSYMNNWTPFVGLHNSQDWDVLQTLMQYLGQKPIMYVKGSNSLSQYATEFSLLLP